MATATSIPHSRGPLPLFHRHFIPEAPIFFLDDPSSIHPHPPGLFPPTSLRRPHAPKARSIRSTFRPHKVLKAPIQSPLSARMRVMCSASVGDRNGFSRFPDGRKFEPVWVSSVKDFLGGVRSIILFLLEQPGQLRHIEWPSFQDTLKTAALTLVLVAVLIVALSSVDVTLSFLLAAFTRKAG